jgi:hypothetical protein
MVVTAEAESRRRVLAGKGEGSRLLQVGLSEATVLLRKIQSYSDPRLFALALVAEQLAQSRQPLVPERVFVAAGGGNGAANGHVDSAQGLLGTLLGLLVAEKSGFNLADGAADAALREFADRMTREVIAPLPGDAPEPTTSAPTALVAAAEATAKPAVAEEITPVPRGS